MPRRRDDEAGWYGLITNGELSHIQYFRQAPLIWDFHTGYFDSRFEYDVVEVEPVITGYLEPVD